MALLAMAPLPLLQPASAPYLPRVGPPPLRFAAPQTAAKKFVYSTATAAPARSAASQADVAGRAPVSAEPPAAAQPAPVARAVDASPLPADIMQNLTNGAPKIRPANDLLIVTPDMLVGYFKPETAGTNSVNTGPVAPVNFTPPSPGAIPSSQAVYRSQ